MTIERRRARAVEWLDVIKTEVQSLYIDHDIFWELQKIVAANDRLEHRSGVFSRWMANGFATASAVAVRRQAKAGDDSISLKRFLREVRDFPELVSREHYLGFFADAEEWLREANGVGYFDSIAGVGAGCISGSLVDEHLNDLSSAVERIEHYVDKRVAHYDKSGLKQPLPTYGDLTTSLEVLDRLTVFYLKLLKGSAPNSLRKPLDPSWIDVFEVPWRPNPDIDDEGYSFS